MSDGFTIRATIHQTPSPDEHQVLADHLIEVDGDGRIATIRPAAGDDHRVDVHLPAGTVLLPGLIDTHLHAPQWPQLATALDRPLEEWLFDHTFPLEARFADLDFAERVWDAMVPALLRGGTTTAVYHASIHEDATTALARACHRHGQRAFVGRVAMDHPTGTPEWYRDADADASVAASRASIDAIRSLDGRAGLVEPIVTPRFIPACSDDALHGLGELAEQTGTLVQTHCSESDWEHGDVIARHGVTDTRSLERLGLLRAHTVLAHATHLTDDDAVAIISSGAGVAHCPLSNDYFSQRVFAARAHIDAGMRVGLGTDVAGGAEPSMLRQCAHAVTSSRRRDDPIDIVTAFWMATLGGAELLGIDAGLLAPGRVFDAVAVDLDAVGVWPDIDDDARTFEKIVRRGSDGIVAVWVDGVAVVSGAAVSPDRAPGSDTRSA
ncbi:MAG: amidohydrolase family protein [Actinomycetota bacterium]